MAGVLLYREPLASGADIIPLVAGLFASALGAIALALQGSTEAVPTVA